MVSGVGGQSNPAGYQPPDTVTLCVDVKADSLSLPEMFAEGNFSKAQNTMSQILQYIHQLQMVLPPLPYSKQLSQIKSVVEVIEMDLPKAVELQQELKKDPDNTTVAQQLQEKITFLHGMSDEVKNLALELPY